MTLSSDLASFAKSIADDMEHGASHILKIASGSLHTALIRNPNASPEDVQSAVKDYAIRLISAQRQMAPILNFCNLLLLEVEDPKDLPALGKNIREFSLRITKDSNEAMGKIAANAAKSISGEQFMTHSRSSTLLHFIMRIRDRKGLLVYVTQSRPGAEGRILAGELSVAGIPSVIIEESEAMIQLPKVSGLLVGADAVIPGGIVNKAGTYMLSLAAKELGIPVYCLTEANKIWPFDEPIVSSISNERTSPMSSSILFELVPGHLFKEIIFESGAMTFDKIPVNREEIKIAPEIRKLAGL